MRQTKKLREARRTALAENLALDGMDQNEIYAELEDNGYYWDSKAGAWSQRVVRPSIFEIDGQPTDMVRVRIMAHPEKLDAVESALKRAGLKFIELSTKDYPNREDVGSRRYLLLSL